MTLLVDTGYVRPPQHQPARTALGPACDCSAVAMNQSLLGAGYSMAILFVIALVSHLRVLLATPVRTGTEVGITVKE